jgi:hypothetical protein
MLQTLDDLEETILIGSSTFKRSGFGKLLDEAGNPTGDFGVRLGRRHLLHGDAALLSHELGHAYFTMTTGEYTPGSPGPSNASALRMENAYRGARGCGARLTHDSQIPFGLNIPSCR